MWRLLTAFLVLAVHLQANELDPFVGEWYAVMSIPNEKVPKICPKVIVRLDAAAGTCECRDLKNVSQLKADAEGEKDSVTFPAIVVHETPDIMKYLNVQCRCAEKEVHHTVLKKLNENFYVLYGLVKEDKAKYNETYPNAARIIAKQVPKLSELNALVASTEDLKSRSSVLLCDLSS